MVILVSENIYLNWIVERNTVMGILTKFKQHLTITRDMIAARIEIGNFYFLTKHYKRVNGFNVYIDDTYVFAVTGVRTFGNAVAIEDKIVINQAALALEPELLEGLINHELGHLVHKHKASFLYPIQCQFGFGSGQRKEYEADDYARRSGGDILGVLYMMQDNGINSPGIRKRIAKLEAAQ